MCIQLTLEKIMVSWYLDVLNLLNRTFWGRNYFFFHSCFIWFFFEQIYKTFCVFHLLPLPYIIWAAFINARFTMTMLEAHPYFQYFDHFFRGIWSRWSLPIWHVTCMYPTNSLFLENDGVVDDNLRMVLVYRLQWCHRYTSTRIPVLGIPAK